MRGPDSADVLNRYRKFLDAGLLQLDRQQIAGDEPFRDRVVGRVSSLFAPSSLENPPRVSPLQTTTPPRTRDPGDKVQFHFPHRIDDLKGQFTGEVTIVVEGDAKTLETDDHPGNWHVVGFKLTSAGPPPTGPGEGGPGRRPRPR
jgi:hypothetical protein